MHTKSSTSKLIQRHVWEEHVEEADYLRHHQDVKPIYEKRKETIETLFADAKEKHSILGHPSGDLKFIDAGDAYFSCHELICRRWPIGLSKVQKWLR
ncbi:hypothetical protein [Cytobacillus firmus]|uniref:hypothetical protein n=1 Tax=Cytobacillus firmus TaxID=1399 RepID=UPI0021BCFE5D|nr:hypothetical protein [Cytobacillus firmus]